MGLLCNGVPEMTKAPSLEELQAQRAELDKKIASQELPHLKAALEAITGANGSGLVADLEAVSAKLGDGPARQAVTNVRQIITAARNAIDRAVRNAEIAAGEITPAAKADGE